MTQNEAEDEKKENTPVKRDELILDVVTKACSSQFDLRDKLDAKINNLVVTIGTVTTISVGFALFVFDKISPDNFYYYSLISTFLAYLLVFIIAMSIGLTGYKPSEYTWYPADPERLIADYAKLSDETAVLRKVAASFAKTANENKKGNDRKAHICNIVFWLFLVGIVVFVIFAVFMILALGVS